ncbi:MAG: hypothetical protein ACOC6Q_01830 [Patescibacteria group bacterium]
MIKLTQINKKILQIGLAVSLIVVAMHGKPRKVSALSHCDPKYCQTGNWWYKAGQAGCDSEGNYTGWRVKCQYTDDGEYCVEYEDQYLSNEPTSFCQGDDNGNGAGGGDDGNIAAHMDWPFTDLGNVLSSFIQVATLLAGILLFIYFTFGGIKYITAGGDKEATAEAKAMITNAVVGVVLVVAAFALTRIVETVFGIRILGGITLPRP